MNNKLTVAPSSHVKDNVTTSTLMATVIMALTPAAVAAVLNFGMRALLLIATCVISCVAFEFAYSKLTGGPNTIGDFSAVVTGLLLAFNLPSTLPLWMAVCGCLFAIAVVKCLFGGIGQNFANPAIVGRIFLLISFSGPMTSWMIPTKVVGGYELVAGATPLSPELVGDLPTYMEMFLGRRGGSLGETCILALLLGGVFLIVRGVIKPHIPLAYLGTVAAMALLCGQDPIFHLMAGGAMLAAFFMATDYVTSPVTDSGKIIFGVGCGLITMVIRLFGNYPEGASFAILLMNIVTPHIETLTRTKPFGGVKA